MCNLLINTYILLNVNIMTVHMSLHKEFNLIILFCVCCFAWQADRIWKISGRQTDSLINMAVYAYATILIQEMVYQ